MEELRVGKSCYLYNEFTERKSDWIIVDVICVTKHQVRFMTEFGYPICLGRWELERKMRAGEITCR